MSISGILSKHFTSLWAFIPSIVVSGWLTLPRAISFHLGKEAKMTNLFQIIEIRHYVLFFGRRSRPIFNILKQETLTLIKRSAGTQFKWPTWRQTIPTNKLFFRWPSLHSWTVKLQVPACALFSQAYQRYCLQSPWERDGGSGFRYIVKCVFFWSLELLQKRWYLQAMVLYHASQPLKETLCFPVFLHRVNTQLINLSFTHPLLQSDSHVCDYFCT